MTAATAELFAYGAVLVSTIVEGEVAYVAAAALVSQGRLDALSVVLLGAIGSAIGDQAYFYAFRGRVTAWLSRSPALTRHAAPVTSLVRRYDWAMVMLIRCAPGLRVVIAAACAHAEVSAVKFSLLNTITCVVWAVALMALVGWLGPAFLMRLGIGGWQGAIVVGLATLSLVPAAGFVQRRMLARDSSTL